MPTHHLGRLVDHVQLRARNLDATKRFYTAVLGALGISVGSESPKHIQFDELWIDALGADEKGNATHVHLAFQATDREAVKRFHAAGLGAGGRDNGAPGERDYHPGYYAAFLIDPDGNNVEAVYHGPAPRSAPWIEVQI
jgi:catechol 2,3-dioxygenase-like lactoylglutathione lyase family enzyme